MHEKSKEKPTKGSPVTSALTSLSFPLFVLCHSSSARLSFPVLTYSVSDGCSFRILPHTPVSPECFPQDWLPSR